MFTRIPLLATLLSITLLPTLPATIPTNPFPFEAFYSYAGEEVIVTSTGWIGPDTDLAGTTPGTVSRVQCFDWRTGQLKHTIDIGPYWDGSAWANVATGLCEVPGAIIVGNSSRDLIRISTSTWQITNRWQYSGPGGPYHPVADVDGNVWATFPAADLVRKIDPQTGAVLATISVPGFPRRAALHAGYLLVTAFTANRLVWIDTGTATVVHSTLVGDRPNDVCTDPEYPVVYSSDYGGSISVVSTASRVVVQTIQLPHGPRSTAPHDPVQPGPHGIYRIGRELWVIDSNRDYIYVMDPFRGTILRYIPTGRDPSFGCITPDSFWYANPLANRVGIVPIKHVW